MVLRYDKCPVWGEMSKKFSSTGLLDDDGKRTIILFDGDILAWRAAAVTDGRVYLCVDGEEFSYKKDAVAHCKDKGLDVDTAIKLEYRPEDISHATHNIDNIINSVVNYVQEELEVDKVYTYHFLSAEEDFRKKVNPEYKEHRKAMRTPVNLVSCKSFLREEYGAISVDPYEADDLLGIVNTMLTDDVYDVYIASVDKDLLQLPSKHLNLNDFSVSKPTDVDILLALYKQIMMGDRTDNIKGLYGIGEKKAEKALRGCQTEDDMAKATFGLYFKVLGVDDIYKALEEMLVTAHQVYILRRSDEYYMPPINALVDVICDHTGQEWGDVLSRVTDIQAYFLFTKLGLSKGSV